MIKALSSLTDTYKLSHYYQYPKGTQQIYSYMESRGGEYDKIVFFGLQYYLKALKEIPLFHQSSWNTALNQLMPFPIDDWKALNKGVLPIEICAVPEGSVNAPGDVLMTITNTDDRYFWLPGWLETYFMKLWYPTTIASKSYAIKQILNGFYKQTSQNMHMVDYAYHNFGDRGSSSVESALIGGMAHLTQFEGTDNFNATVMLPNYYRTNKPIGSSIPASEHSTVTSWDNEFSMYEEYLEESKIRGYQIIACVLDSYNIYDAVNFVTSGNMKQRIESDDYPVFVIRPDSGDPVTVINSILNIMEKNNVAYRLNSKNYKVFSKYRIIWGDGITPKTIANILYSAQQRGYAADNFAFGSGGDLMQNITRDTCKFAIKCSAAKVNGEWRDVYKNPITDPGKVSKRGLVTNPKMRPVYRNGELLINDSFYDIRKRSMEK